MKYIDAEKLIEGIKHIQSKFPVITYEALFHLITSLQQEQPSLPSNLDEAASLSARCYRDWDYPPTKDKKGNEIALYDVTALEEMFKTGAEWMAGQGETIDGEIILLPHTQTRFHLMAAIDKNLGYKAGDKVVVQIRKK